MTGWLLVCAGAALGAPARFLLERAVQRRHRTGLPWGTLMVNLVGCLVLGLLVGSGASESVLLLAGTGFCAAFTTYSTFSFETLRLLEDRRVASAAAYVVVSVVGGVALAVAGYTMASSLF